MSDLIFEEPPAKGYNGPGAGSAPIGRWLDALRSHPGQWAKFPDHVASPVATYIRKGTAHGAKPGEFEVRTVGTDAPRPRVYLYARFLGASLEGVEG